MRSAEPATPKGPARRVIPFQGPRSRRREELAFLPAALEIVETPPSPVGRAIGSVIIFLFCVALIWAWWGTIDIVASATGKILPSGRVKVIQPFETAVVRSIRVQDGQSVKAGDVLIELDPTANEAERDHQRNDLLAEQLNIARLRAALSDDPLADFAPPAGAVMMVTVPALTASTFGNVHRLDSGLKTGCWLGACCGGGAAGVVCAVASCNDRLTAAAANASLMS